jgi:hypothetical protein
MATQEIGTGTAATLPLTGTETISLRQGTTTVFTALADLPSGTPAAGSVTNSILADMATSTIKGRSTAGTGDPEDLTGAQVAVITQGAGLDVDAAGFRGVPQNSQSGNYTCVAADSGKEILHPSGAGAGDTFTLPANASVAFEIGTVIVFTNLDSNALSIAITSDTLILSPGGTTGTRTLAQYGQATARKVTSTSWLISGTGLT